MLSFSWARRGGWVALGALASLALAGCGGAAPHAHTSTSVTKAPAKSLKETAKEGGIGLVTPPPPLPKGDRADPDSLNMGGADISWVLNALGGDRYELHLTNTSRVGFIDQINWEPPRGDHIQSIGRSSVGSCTLVAGRVTCGGLHLKPPVCLCRPGGTATVIFRMHLAKNTGVQTSRLQILAMTPVPYNIPSVPGESKST